MSINLYLNIGNELASHMNTGSAFHALTTLQTKSYFSISVRGFGRYNLKASPRNAKLCFETCEDLANRLFDLESISTCKIYRGTVDHLCHNGSVYLADLKLINLDYMEYF